MAAPPLKWSALGVNKVYLALGSNCGDRRSHLEFALSKIKGISQGRHLRVSSLYETPALIPADAPSDWLDAHYNLCCEIIATQNPMELLRFVKTIEKELGRSTDAARWAPRVMDIDILLYGDEILQSKELTLPHPAINERAFVLDPLSELLPAYLPAARKHPQHQPRIMGILNASADSFSNTEGEHVALWQKIDEWVKYPLAYVDLGAVSTRPGAAAVTIEDEWQRLRSPLQHLKETTKNSHIKPKISIDTFNSEIARRCLELGAETINDVSGLRTKDSAQMLEVLKGSNCEYILMHSLSIPADTQHLLDESKSCIPPLLEFFKEKLNLISKEGIALDRIILDPGVGFGKSAKHSLEIMKELSRFSELGCPLLVGHSRKSFMKKFSPLSASNRDIESLALSLKLGAQGTDILRVHDPINHQRAFLAQAHI